VINSSFETFSVTENSEGKKNAVFWDAMSCSLVEVTRVFWNLLPTTWRQ